jgi:predicted kinase
VRPRLILISGLPGAGQTTLARTLEQRVRGVWPDGDTWMLELGIDLHDEAVRARLEVLFWGLSQRILSLGQRVILESGFWLREDRDEKRLGARALSAGVELHDLDVPFQERWNRASRRNREPICVDRPSPTTSSPDGIDPSSRRARVSSRSSIRHRRSGTPLVTRGRTPVGALRHERVPWSKLRVRITGS